MVGVVGSSPIAPTNFCGTWALFPGPCAGPAPHAVGPAAFVGIPVDCILFAVVLIGVAAFDRHTVRLAMAGLAVITLYKRTFSPFHGVAGVAMIGGSMALAL